MHGYVVELSARESALVRYLRRKLGPEWIATVRGAGYRLETG